MDRENMIRTISVVPDFPKPGIRFYDITTLMKNPAAMGFCLDAMQEVLQGKVDVICAAESRGFIFGAALADRLKMAFVPIRKPGKLPRKIFSEPLTKEYGSDEVQIHQDDLSAGERVAFVDDVLATGGTALACRKLVEQCGAEWVLSLYLIDLELEGQPEGLKQRSVIRAREI